VRAAGRRTSLKGWGRVSQGDVGVIDVSLNPPTTAASATRRSRLRHADGPGGRLCRRRRRPRANLLHLARRQFRAFDVDDAFVKETREETLRCAAAEEVSAVKAAAVWEDVDAERNAACFPSLSVTALRSLPAYDACFMF